MGGTGLRLVETETYLLLILFIYAHYLAIKCVCVGGGVVIYWMGRK